MQDRLRCIRVPGVSVPGCAGRPLVCVSEIHLELVKLEAGTFCKRAPGDRAAEGVPI